MKKVYVEGVISHDLRVSNLIKGNGGIINMECKRRNKIGKGKVPPHVSITHEAEARRIMWEGGRNRTCLVCDLESCSWAPRILAFLLLGPSLFEGEHSSRFLITLWSVPSPSLYLYALHAVWGASKRNDLRSFCPWPLQWDRGSYFLRPPFCVVGLSNLELFKVLHGSE